MSSGFPIDFDVSHNMIAFVYTEINEESMAQSMLKTLEEGNLVQNVYLREAASKLVNISHQSLETIGNLLNVNRASTIPGEAEINDTSYDCKCQSGWRRGSID